MSVTLNGEIIERPNRAERRLRLAGEIVTVPLPREGQRRRLVWPIVCSIYRSLCKKTGASFATDFAIVAMVWKDLGHIFHPKSIARARRRAAKLGLITSKRIRPNRKAGTRRTYAGTVRVRFPEESEARAARWREKIERRKQRRAAAAAKQKQKVQRRAEHPTRDASELVSREPALSKGEIGALLRRAPLPFLSPQGQSIRTTGHGVDADRERPNDSISDDPEARAREVARQLKAAAEFDTDARPPKPDR